MAFLGLSFLAGVLSVLAACVLPLLPVIVGGSLSTGGSRKRAYTIVAALAVSIVFFTLILKASTALIGVPESLWSYLSGGIVTLIGVFMVFPNLWVKVPLINRLNRSSNVMLTQGYQRGGFTGDVIMGAALGPVFASCSPTYFIILATVLPATPLLGLVYLIAYAIGLSLTLLVIAFAGEALIQRLGVALTPDGKFMRGIGVLLVVVGVLVFTGEQKKIEAWLVERGFDATSIELRLLGAEENGVSDPQRAFVSPDMKKGVYKVAPELVSPDGYINTGGEPITIEQFKGKKVVLLDIWTYSCINCQRTLPYVNSWYEKYADEGLEIIGLHTPEFAFEKVYGNVAQAVQGFGIKYPVVLDNEYQTWNAYGNQFWPRKYLIDIDGYIVYDHIGEGDYAETEDAIVRALQERAQRLGETMPEEKAGGTPAEVEVQAASPETYFGSSRNSYLGNGKSGVSGEQTLSLPERMSRNMLYLGGTWNIMDEYARSVASASIAYTFASKSVYFVAAAKSPVKIKVLLDGGEVPAQMRGADVDAQGYVTVQTDRLYKIIESDTFGEHTLELQVEGTGLEAYTFTFG